MSDEPTYINAARTGAHVLADPTVLTTQQLRHEMRGVEREFGQRQETRERESDNLQELIETRLNGIDALNAERFAAQGREDAIREAHRLELKTDNQRNVETAMIAAEKAVQAALAAAEKARDQQTIASQLATDKAEKAGQERVQQQGETFTLAISSLTSGQNDLKSMVGELRAEKRGGQEQVQETQGKGASTGMWIGIGVAALIGFVSLILGVIDVVLKLQGV